MFLTIVNRKLFYKFYLGERIGYAIWTQLQHSEDQKERTIQACRCCRCQLFVSSHPMDGLLVNRLTSNKHASYFKYIVRSGVISTTCNKVGLIPP